MKTRNLNGAIRKNEGSVKINIVTAHGIIQAGLVKSELLAAIGALHKDPQAETGLVIVDGVIAHETDGDRFAARSRRDAETGYFASEVDVENLLGGSDSEVDLLDTVEDVDVEDLLGGGDDETDVEDLLA